VARGEPKVEDFLRKRGSVENYFASNVTYHNTT